MANHTISPGQILGRAPNARRTAEPPVCHDVGRALDGRKACGCKAYGRKAQKP